MLGEFYPRLLEATGRCPPEDIGGPPAYAEALEAVSVPRHEQHAECKEWIPEDFDPNADSIVESLTDLAKQWSRKPSKRSKTKPADLRMPTTKGSLVSLPPQ